MPWFKVDDTFAMHEKVMAAGNAAIGLWTRAGAWSMQQLTDGFVPDHVLRALGTPKERRTLVEVSLWVEAEGGVQFQNWEERQPTKEQVEAARQAAKERQRHARERAKSRRESRRDATRDFAGSHGPPDPTRPDPTVVPTELPPSEGATRKRAHQLPDTWQPNDAHRALAAERGVDVELEATKMRDWAASEGKAGKDWDARFRNWLRGARPTLAASTTRAALPAVHDVEQPPDGLSDEEYAAWAHRQAARRRA